MFQLRKETDYAIKFLKALSMHEHRPLSLHDVSLATKISFLFLQKIARKLRLAGLIASTHGQNGGYTLAMPAGRITLNKIIVTMQGHCELLPKLKKVNQQITRVLTKVKLKDL
ncbi:MAG: Rrf2 family transcriptional regulator [bacterium]|nr:Rrf2 family transcriptional regulator [bacterium]